MKPETFSDKLEKTHIVYLHETVAQSVGRDIGTALVFVALWSFGYFVGSAALEWVGVLFGVIGVFLGTVARIEKATDRIMTPKQAREWLDKHFPEQDA